MKITDITKDEIATYYVQYMNKLEPNTSLLDGFKSGMDKVIAFFKSLPNEKLEFAYASGKWTVKEVLQHLIDVERVFFYRAFRIARHDKTSLTGFDQNKYIEPSGANGKTLDELLNEFKATRQASIALIESLTHNDLTQTGSASNVVISARGALFTIIGHDIWHMDVIKEKYI